MTIRPILAKQLTIAFIHVIIILLWACSAAEKPAPEKADQVAANIKMYTKVWDDIMNKGQLELLNDSNFANDVVFYMKPANVVGIDSAKAYYGQFLKGFSDIQFTMKNVFGQDDHLVKHWKFKGTHTGEFFGIPATGKSVDLDGATIVKMKDGKIASEQDFFDNMDLMTQLGLVPAQ
jgi:steroid delta-isomerase-like uncharacterized protein